MKRVLSVSEAEHKWLSCYLEKAWAMRCNKIVFGEPIGFFSSDAQKKMSSVDPIEIRNVTGNGDSMDGDKLGDLLGEDDAALGSFEKEFYEVFPWRKQTHCLIRDEKIAVWFQIGNEWRVQDYFDLETYPVCVNAIANIWLIFSTETDADSNRIMICVPLQNGKSLFLDVDICLEKNYCYSITINNGEVRNTSSEKSQA
ncbi:MAG: hypothetical protein PHV34_20085 [Verrucomicrobiae bacterium]|nr:hypothetical protein [Verrucomicrobiae bacterium]